MAKKELQTQRDFSGGEMVPAAKRRDDIAQVRTGSRQLKNVRMTATGGVQQRPGRSAVYLPDGTRNEYVRLSSTVELHICFSEGAVTLRTLAGAVVATNTSATYLWTAATLAQVSWCLAVADIVICFPGMQPQLVKLDRTNNTWSFVGFAFRTLNAAVQEPFYRYSALGATMTPSGLTGSITLTCSVPYFTAQMVGRTLSIIGQQVTITSIISSTVAVVTVANQLCGWVIWGGATTPQTFFKTGSLASDATAGVKAEIGTYSGLSSTQIAGTRLDTVNNLFSYAYSGGAFVYLISPLGQVKVTDFASTNIPQPTVQWQEEFMGPVAGWPAACFYDRNRLGFCNFPQMPEAILWSAIGFFDIFWVDSSAVQTSAVASIVASSPILEFIPGKPIVSNVVGWGDEFVFTDRGIYQIPISVSSPLRPGSVEFRQVSSDGVSDIRPVTTELAVLYLNAGTNRVSAITATGAATRPYVSSDLSDAHSHLFTGPVALAIDTGDGKHPERYVYIVNADGTVVVGKFTSDKQFVGWVPWIGSDAVKWISASGGFVWHTVKNANKTVVLLQDDNAYLDGAVPINAIPAGMVLALKGPCIAYAGGTVSVMSGQRDFGDRPVDANGFIVANVDDDFSGIGVIAGQPWTITYEPFVFQAQPGPDVKQRIRRRKIARAFISVQDSSGFTWGDRDIPPYNFGDDPTLDPPLRETTYRCSPLGRDFDPTVAATKSRPGPWTMLECALEVTI